MFKLRKNQVSGLIFLSICIIFISIMDKCGKIVSGNTDFFAGFSVTAKAGCVAFFRLFGSTEYSTFSLML